MSESTWQFCELLHREKDNAIRVLEEKDGFYRERIVDVEENHWEAEKEDVESFYK